MKAFLSPARCCSPARGEGRARREPVRAGRADDPAAAVVQGVDVLDLDSVGTVRRIGTDVADARPVRVQDGAVGSRVVLAPELRKEFDGAEPDGVPLALEVADLAVKGVERDDAALIVLDVEPEVRRMVEERRERAGVWSRTVEEVVSQPFFLL